MEGIVLVRPNLPEEMSTALAGADGLITYLWDDKFLGNDLKWLQAISAGVDQFPLRRLGEAGIVVTSARGAHSPAVADHAIALLLSLLRRIGPAVRRSVGHRWEPEIAHETDGLTVGVVGLGSIGEAVAQRLTGLGMNVMGVKRDPSAYQGVVKHVFGPDHLLRMFEECDAAILTLPSLPDTDRLITGRHFTALRGGWLVNVGRGSVLDEQALIEALSEGCIRGAALDVTVDEPLSDESPLWDMEQVIITPHMAWASDRLTPRLVEIVKANLDAIRGVRPWVNRVM
ncbi:MAG: D-2-hydroxyacid dehydrogenase [Acidimicrobiia bacterium]